MPKVTYVAHDGVRTTADVPVGENVMRGALYNNIEGIVGECGGGLACATCHVFVDDGWLSRVGERSEVEQQMLEFSPVEMKPNSRLSCQIVMTPALDGLIVRMPEKQF